MASLTAHRAAATGLSPFPSGHRRTAAGARRPAPGSARPERAPLCSPKPPRQTPASVPNSRRVVSSAVPLLRTVDGFTSYLTWLLPVLFVAAHFTCAARYCRHRALRQHATPALAPPADVARHCHNRRRPAVKRHAEVATRPSAHSLRCVASPLGSCSARPRSRLLQAITQR